MALTDAQKATLQTHQQTVQQQVYQKRQEIALLSQAIGQFSSDLGQYPEQIFFSGVPSGVDQDDPPLTRTINYQWDKVDETFNLGNIVQKITELRKFMDQLEDATSQLAAG